MSFADEHAETVRPSCVLYRCRRCQDDVVLEQPNPVIHVREAIEHKATMRVHDCADGAHGVADLIGSGPGVWPPKVPERPAPEVVITEKGKAGRMTGAERED